MMNKFFNILPILLVVAGPLSSAEETNMSRRIGIEPIDHGLALVNPQMGWTTHFYSNKISNCGSKPAPHDTLDDFPGLSCVYLRVPWSFLEPKEGRFKWSLPDYAKGSVW